MEESEFKVRSHSLRLELRMKTGRWLWGDETESSPIQDAATTEPGSHRSPLLERSSEWWQGEHWFQQLTSGTVTGCLAQVTVGADIDGRNLR